jgi:hypothetical protein
MKLWQKISLGIVAVIIVFVGKTLYNAGMFINIKPHFNGSVIEINGFTGAEDITIDKAKGIALISSNNFSDTSQNGAIFLLNIKNNYFASCACLSLKFSTACVSSFGFFSVSGFNPSKARIRLVSSTEHEISPFSSEHVAITLTPGISLGSSLPLE